MKKKLLALITTTMISAPTVFAFHEADTGLVVMDGKLIEKPVIREMQRIVSIANKLKIEI